MTALLKAAGACGAVAPKTYVNDVFVPWLRNGTAASATITTGFQPDLVWTKTRSGTTGHYLTDSERGVTKSLNTNNTNLEATDTSGITAFSATGYTVGSDTNYNNNASTYVDWAFKKSAKFFDVVTWSGDNTAERAIPHDLGVAPGMIILKCTSSSAEADWIVWHRSLSTVTGHLVLNTTAAASNAGFFSSSGQSATTLNLGVNTGGIVQYTNGTGRTYVAYLFAHDDTSDGIIQCGSFTTDGSGNATVSLGWEPQYIFAKPTAVGAWEVYDIMRSLTATANTSTMLNPNNADAEGTANDRLVLTSTGFKHNAGFGVSATAIYIAIRRPNKLPTSGSQVYGGQYRSGSSMDTTVSPGGIMCDMAWVKATNASHPPCLATRLIGGNSYLTPYSGAPCNTAASVVTGFDVRAGYRLGTTDIVNGEVYTYMNFCFKRAPGVFDVFCDTGTGSSKSEAHNLAAIPELWVRKSRSNSYTWVWGSAYLTNEQKIDMPSTAGRVDDSTAWNSTYPTSTQFSVGSATTTNASGATFVTYLWATLAGVSKVFSYTGDGNTGRVINCGFTAGARFVLIINATASTPQDIFVWNATRGIVSGDDPHLSMGTAVSEITNDDSIDPDNSGFIVNQLSATSINTNGETYIGLAYA